MTSSVQITVIILFVELKRKVSHDVFDEKVKIIIIIIIFFFWKNSNCTDQYWLFQCFNTHKLLVFFVRIKHKPVVLMA